MTYAIMTNDYICAFTKLDILFTFLEDLAYPLYDTSYLILTNDEKLKISYDLNKYSLKDLRKELEKYANNI